MNSRWLRRSLRGPQLHARCQDRQTSHARPMGAVDHRELLRRHRLTVEQCHRMGEAGVIGPELRLELLVAELVEMAPIGTRHAAAV